MISNINFINPSQTLPDAEKSMGAIAKKIFEVTKNPDIFDEQNNIEERLVKDVKNNIRLGKKLFGYEADYQVNSKKSKEDYNYKKLQRKIENDLYFMANNGKNKEQIINNIKIELQSIENKITDATKRISKKDEDIENIKSDIESYYNPDTTNDNDINNLIVELHQKLIQKEIDENILICLKTYQNEFNTIIYKWTTLTIKDLSTYRNNARKSFTNLLDFYKQQMINNWINVKNELSDVKKTYKSNQDIDNVEDQVDDFIREQKRILYFANDFDTAKGILQANFTKKISNIDDRIININQKTNKTTDDENKLKVLNEKKLVLENFQKELNNNKLKKDMFNVFLSASNAINSVVITYKKLMQNSLLSLQKDFEDIQITYKKNRAIDPINDEVDDFIREQKRILYFATDFEFVKVKVITDTQTKFVEIIKEIESIQDFSEENRNKVLRNFENFIKYINSLTKNNFNIFASAINSIESIFDDNKKFMQESWELLQEELVAIKNTYKKNRAIDPINDEVNDFIREQKRILYFATNFDTAKGILQANFTKKISNIDDRIININQKTNKTEDDEIKLKVLNEKKLVLENFQKELNNNKLKKDMFNVFLSASNSIKSVVKTHKKYMNKSLDDLKEEFRDVKNTYQNNRSIKKKLDDNLLSKKRHNIFEDVSNSIKSVVSANRKFVTDGLDTLKKDFNDIENTYEENIVTDAIDDDKNDFIRKQKRTLYFANNPSDVRQQVITNIEKKIEDISSQIKKIFSNDNKTEVEQNKLNKLEEVKGQLSSFKDQLNADKVENIWQSFRDTNKEINDNLLKTVENRNITLQNKKDQLDLEIQNSPDRDYQKILRFSKFLEINWSKLRNIGSHVYAIVNKFYNYVKFGIKWPTMAITKYVLFPVAQYLGRAIKYVVRDVIWSGIKGFYSIIKFLLREIVGISSLILSTIVTSIYQGIRIVVTLIARHIISPGFNYLASFIKYIVRDILWSGIKIAYSAIKFVIKGFLSTVSLILGAITTSIYQGIRIASMAMYKYIVSPIAVNFGRYTKYVVRDILWSGVKGVYSVTKFVIKSFLSIISLIVGAITTSIYQGIKIAIMAIHKYALSPIFINLGRAIRYVVRDILWSGVKGVYSVTKFVIKTFLSTVSLIVGGIITSIYQGIKIASMAIHKYVLYPVVISLGRAIRYVVRDILWSGIKVMYSSIKFVIKELPTILSLIINIIVTTLYQGIKWGAIRIYRQLLQPFTSFSWNLIKNALRWLYFESSYFVTHSSYDFNNWVSYFERKRRSNNENLLFKDNGISYVKQLLPLITQIENISNLSFLDETVFNLNPIKN